MARKSMVIIDFEMVQPSGHPFQLGWAIIDEGRVKDHGIYYITLPEGIEADKATFIDLCHTDLEAYETFKLPLTEIYRQFCADMDHFGIRRIGSWGNDKEYFERLVNEPWVKACS